MKLLAACPVCGGTDWVSLPSGSFECESCGYECYPEEMVLTSNEAEDGGDESC